MNLNKTTELCVMICNSFHQGKLGQHHKLHINDGFSNN